MATHLHFNGENLINSSESDAAWTSPHSVALPVYTELKKKVTFWNLCWPKGPKLRPEPATVLFAAASTLRLPFCSNPLILSQSHPGFTLKAADWSSYILTS